MADKLRLHYAPDNASLCVRIALETLGLPYDTALVDRRTSAQKSARYLALNPNGLIPVLETPDGPMFETGAILLWLADRQGRLVPTPQDGARGNAVQWLFWIANTLHPTQRMLFYPTQFSGGDTTAMTQTTRDRLRAQLRLLNDAKDAPWLDSDAPSAMGCYLGPMLRWCTIYGGSDDWFDLSDFPRLHAFARREEQRDAVIRCAIAEGLGDTPFTTPSPCNPPQGSAL